MSNVTENYRSMTVERRYFRGAALLPNFVEAQTGEELTAAELAGRYNALLMERNELLLELNEAQRTIKAQAEQLVTTTMRANGVLTYINGGADKWEHVTGEGTQECQLCGYDWPCPDEIIRRSLIGVCDEDMRVSNVSSEKDETWM